MLEFVVFHDIPGTFMTFASHFFSRALWGFLIMEDVLRAQGGGSLSSLWRLWKGLFK